MLSLAIRIVSMRILVVRKEPTGLCHEALSLPRFRLTKHKEQRQESWLPRGH